MENTHRTGGKQKKLKTTGILVFPVFVSKKFTFSILHLLSRIMSIGKSQLADLQRIVSKYLK